MIKMNTAVDIRNIGSNDFKTEQEVQDFWKTKENDPKYVITMFDEYHGLDKNFGADAFRKHKSIEFEK